MQLLVYFIRFGKDSNWLKFFVRALPRCDTDNLRMPNAEQVLSVWGLDTLHQVLISHARPLLPMSAIAVRLRQSDSVLLHDLQLRERLCATASRLVCRTIPEAFSYINQAYAGVSWYAA
jgi:predicted protein tyrosine phosphatase